MRVNENYIGGHGVLILNQKKEKKEKETEEREEKCCDPHFKNKLQQSNGFLVKVYSKSCLMAPGVSGSFKWIVVNLRAFNKPSVEPG